MMSRPPKHTYELVPRGEDSQPSDFPEGGSFREKRIWERHPVAVLIGGLSGIFFFALLLKLLVSGSLGIALSCDDPIFGFQCRPNISFHWGQYSPFFTVPSAISADVPPECEISFAQVLSRHGARDPTLGKSLAYAVTVAKIKNRVQSFQGDYAFLKDYNYTLGADQLTVFGQQQMVDSGASFYKRYQSLTKKMTPFIRASGQKRVIDSAQNFTQGFHKARSSDKNADKDSYPYPILIVSESSGMNNTLSHDVCKQFENSKTGRAAQAHYEPIFVPPIMKRLNENLPKANLNIADTIMVMDLCPYETVASVTGELSPFCSLFTEDEWKQYGYYQSLGKWYGFSNGNPLGPTQGVGFVNELIARMTGKPVNDHTNVNHTLDDDAKTFPVGADYKLFADFSHDNDMSSIFAAFGLYNNTSPLSNTTLEETGKTRGYSASWTVPFAARAYFEKMKCKGSKEEHVRILVNDRVIPLEYCGADSLGRCKLSKFVESMSFAVMGGHWDQCF